jgi:hypothetical protein
MTVSERRVCAHNKPYTRMDQIVGHMQDSDTAQSLQSFNSSAEEVTVIMQLSLCFLSKVQIP